MVIFASPPVGSKQLPEKPPSAVVVSVQLTTGPGSKVKVSFPSA
jgi:hypothetical protein